MPISTSVATRLYKSNRDEFKTEQCSVRTKVPDQRTVGRFQKFTVRWRRSEPTAAARQAWNSWQETRRKRNVSVCASIQSKQHVGGAASTAKCCGFDRHSDYVDGLHGAVVGSDRASDRGAGLDEGT